ncbi:hypothetical protein F5Y18DRAFT_307425 [Xylariaceae sp. FL1019]|nr:hypothetical protein F5Y18DRAFT_307425 [Xylariaceae sp. FL1019]
MTEVPLARTKPLSFMETINPLVSVYRPSPSPSIEGTHERQPRLIIIASWTDAKDAHIAKYIVHYQALYPAAQILLLRSTIKHILRPNLIGPSIKHAASVVRAAFQMSTSPSVSSPDLLIHIFSNGGSSSMANLYEQYAATAGPNDERTLPQHVTIFDSCPGLYQIPRAIAFVSVGLSSFQRILVAPFLYLWAVAWSAAMALGLLPDSLGDWSKAHNEYGNYAELRRVYIYSADDALTNYKDVERHADEAEAKGFSVTLEKFSGSAHVAHLRKDEGRYWEIVRTIMEGP